MMKILSLSLTSMLVMMSIPSLADVAKGLSAKLSANAYLNDSLESWLNGGLGRFSSGDVNADDQGAFIGQLDLGYKTRFWSNFEFSTHLQARDASASDARDRLGIVEAKLRYIQPLDDNQRLLFTLGQFFLSTSMENTDNFWDSPYTITWSSLNSWIAEEFRPIGLEANYSVRMDKDKLSFGATGFKGNDSSGALLSWRGFSYGNTLSYLAETLPLPDLVSLNEGGLYAAQRDDGTKPFAEDLDDNWGYALAASLSRASVYQLKLTAIDNRGDGELYQGEYAWHTKFFIVGGKYHLSDQWLVLAEYSQGSTAMGPESLGVDVDFTSAYILTSYLHDDWRYSLRLDSFDVEDQNPTRNTPTLQDINDDKGQSLTVAIFWEPAGAPWNIGVEVLALDQTRQRLIDGAAVSFNGLNNSAANTDVIFNDHNTNQLALEANKKKKKKTCRNEYE